MIGGGGRGGGEGRQVGHTRCAVSACRIYQVELHTISVGF